MYKIAISIGKEVKKKIRTEKKNWRNRHWHLARHNKKEPTKNTKQILAMFYCQLQYCHIVHQRRRTSPISTRWLFLRWCCSIGMLFVLALSLYHLPIKHGVNQCVMMILLLLCLLYCFHRHTHTSHDRFCDRPPPYGNDFTQSISNY